MIFHIEGRSNIYTINIYKMQLIFLLLLHKSRTTVHEISIGALYSIFWAVWADFCGRIVPLGGRGPKISDQT